MIGEPHPAGMPVEWNGQVYASQRAASRAAKVDPSTIEYHLNKYGNLNRLGLMKAKPVNLPRLPWEENQ